ncbi:type VII secretion target [Mycolicibacterium baixiangningiae]|uniref:type VII secretion target n=1 Tax=Mycolicibacterium baixiangningiae TaxID=2761578 RepID=UPI0018D00296|nr:type VII secretion target [Mycolicibacterium baixiangningiae]
MSGDVLQVNPPVLTGAGAAFGQAGTGVAGLQADAPLADAASAVAALQTAVVCRQAQTDIGALTATVAGAAREFGQNLRTAATRYESGDRAGRDAIAKVELSGV